MKKLLFLLALIVSNVAFSQVENDSISTTLEEYNYIANNGLRRHIEEGNDMKQNYQLVPFHSQKFQNQFEIDYFLFYRKEIGLKAIAVKVKSFITNKTHYVCIPINNDELLKEYYKLVNTFTEPLAKAFSYSTGDALGKVAFEHYKVMKGISNK